MAIESNLIKQHQIISKNFYQLMLYYDLCPVIKINNTNFKRIVIKVIISSKIFITILFYSYIATQPYYLKKNIILEILNSKEYIRSNLSLN